MAVHVSGLLRIARNDINTVTARSEATKQSTHPSQRTPKCVAVHVSGLLRVARNDKPSVSIRTRKGHLHQTKLLKQQV